jgi:hypothetical protein
VTFYDYYGISPTSTILIGGFRQSFILFSDVTGLTAGSGSNGFMEINKRLVGNSDISFKTASLNPLIVITTTSLLLSVSNIDKAKQKTKHSKATNILTLFFQFTHPGTFAPAPSYNDSKQLACTENKIWLPTANQLVGIDTAAGTFTRTTAVIGPG